MRNPFDRFLPQLNLLAKTLLKMEPIQVSQKLPSNVPEKGIYLFSKGQTHLYVGKSDNIRRRLHLHTRPSAQQNQATFAFKIAREKMGIAGPSYRKKGSRPDLLKNPSFEVAFNRVKLDIKKMNLRYISVENPLLQTLLEIYVALYTKSKYNEFKNT